MFSHPYITEIIRTKLDVGDYCCQFEDGYIAPICFERKSIPDLFSTLTQGRERFKKEIDRAKAKDIKLILIVEGSFTKVMNGIPQSMMDGLTIIRQMMTLWIKYGLMPVFCKDREEMSRFILEYYFSIGRIKGKKKT